MRELDFGRLGGLGGWFDEGWVDGCLECVRESEGLWKVRARSQEIEAT